jgi:hypothetical protein
MSVTKEIEELLRREPKVLWSALKNVESLRRLVEKLPIFSGTIYFLVETQHRKRVEQALDAANARPASAVRFRHWPPLLSTT